jgi:hypothetical protein
MVRDGRFLFPCAAYHREFGERPGNRICYWDIWTEEHEKAAKAKGEKSRHNVGQIIWRPMRGLTKAQQRVAEYRIVTALQRRDENGDIYDLTRVFFEELVKHPFAAHDDLIDAASRIYDLDPNPPTRIDDKSTEPLGIEAEPEGVEGPDDDF